MFYRYRQVLCRYRQPLFSRTTSFANPSLSRVNTYQLALKDTLFTDVFIRVLHYFNSSQIQIAIDRFLQLGDKVYLFYIRRARARVLNIQYCIHNCKNKEREVLESLGRELWEFFGGFARVEPTEGCKVLSKFLMQVYFSPIVVLSFNMKCEQSSNPLGSG